MLRWSTRSSVYTWIGPVVAIVVFLATVWLGAWLLNWLFRDIPALSASSPGAVIVSLMYGGFHIGLLYLAYRLADKTQNFCRQRRVDRGAVFCGRCGYNLTGNVSGRCPECGMDDVGHVLNCLRLREQRHRFKCRAMIVSGLPLSLLGAVTLASLFWLAAQFGGRFGSVISSVRWMDLFVVLTIITVPLLYHLELRTGGSYRADLSDSGLGPGRAYMLAQSSIGLFAAAAANRRAISSVPVELFIFGPRLVLGGFHQAKLARRVRLADPGPAARIVCRLLGRESGLETATLLRAGATMEEVMPPLAYLAFHQWIGIGEGWGRVWLHSDARRLLSGSPSR